MSKEIYATIKGEKVIIGYVDSNKQFTFREDIDMSIISKRVWKWLEKMYNVNQNKDE